MPGQGALYARRVLLGHVPCLEMQQDFFPQRGVLVWSAATGNRQTESVLTDQKSLRSRTWSGVAAALVFGALPALAFPAPSWWWLAWFGIVPLLLVVRAAPTARAAALRSCCGMAGYILATQYWLLPSTGPLLIVLAIGLGALWLPWGLAAYLLLGEPITARGTLAAMAVLPSAWVMAEAVRSWPSLGGPWASLGASQWNQPATLASASLGGVWLTTFVIVGANTAIAGVILHRRVSARVIAATVALACAGLGPAWFWLGPSPPAGSTVRVALVQPGDVGLRAPVRRLAKR